MRSRKPLILFWTSTTLFLLVIAWWIVFFYRESELIVDRLAASGVAFSPQEVGAVRDAIQENLLMFMAEGSVLAIIAVGGVFVVLRSMRQEVEMHRRQRDFLSAITHELRSPVAAARLQVDSARDERISREQHDRYLNNTLQDLDRLNDTISKILSAARASSGRLKLRLEPLDLTEQTRLVVERVGAIYGPDVEIVFSGPDSIPVVTDVLALRTIVENLVSNAVKYGGEPPRVEVIVGASGGRALLEVRDKGNGMTAKEVREVFEPFVRGTSEVVERRPGIGLGLYLVAELSRAMGGAVRADNRADGGLSVQVALPLAPPHEDDLDHPEDAP